MVVNRHESIRVGLEDLVRLGVIGGWEAGSPGGKGKRWQVWGWPGPWGSGRSMSTTEVEVFLLGVRVALESTGWQDKRLIALVWELKLEEHGR